MLIEDTEAISNKYREFLRAVKLVKMLNPLMDEASNNSDSSQEDTWNISDDDRPLARLRADPIYCPKQAIEERRQRLPEHTRIA